MSSFAQQLNKLRIDYESSEERRTAVDSANRFQALDYFLDKYIRTSEAQAHFEKVATEAATVGKKLVQLETWTGRGPVYANHALSDLLDLADLCERLQDVFNTKYGENEFRVFHYSIRNSRTTALTVSWDKDGFENADGIIRSNRLRAQQRLENRSAEREESATDDRPRRREHSNQSDAQGWTRQRTQPFTRRDTREPRENFTPRAPRENFTPREPREPREHFTPREPREPRENFTPREPRDAPVTGPDGRQQIRPRRRVPDSN